MSPYDVYVPCDKAQVRALIHTVVCFLSLKSTDFRRHSSCLLQVLQGKLDIHQQYVL